MPQIAQQTVDEIVLADEAVEQRLIDRTKRNVRAPVRCLATLSRGK